MKLVFVSNFFNPHQKALSDAFYKFLGSDYVFVATTPMASDRIEMGMNSNVQEPYVLEAYKDSSSEKKAMELLKNCDVAVLGSAPYAYEKCRLTSEKLMFKYSERFFKGKNNLLNNVRFFISSMKHLYPLKKENVYFLCSSAYTAYDINRFCSFKNRAFKWGYFPKVNQKESYPSKKENSILWVGRMIDWKHPEIAVTMAERLKRDHITFHLTMIGSGAMNAEIEALVKKKGLIDIITLYGARTREEVMTCMAESEIFVGTSDFKEGWGVVLNEAMDNSCAVVVSHSTGAAPYLIKDRKNGLIYQNGDIDGLCKLVEQLLMNKALVKNYGLAGHKTLIEEWNATVAVERFIDLAANILAGNTLNLPVDGPCSKAEIIKNDWFKR